MPSQSVGQPTLNGHPPADCYCDSQGEPGIGADWFDLTGCYDTIGSAVYYHFGDNYAYFRERVDGDPSGVGMFKQGTWVVLFDLPAPGSYEYLLSVNGKVQEQVELWHNLDDFSTIEWNPILGDEADGIIWSGSTADYARIVHRSYHDSFK